MPAIFKINKPVYYLSILFVLLLAACGKQKAPTPTSPVTPPPVIVPPPIVVVPPPVVPQTDVYVSGNLINNFKSTAVYWKNGVVVKLGNGTENTVASGIVVNGTDVYVAGAATISGKNTAVYWKNGNMVLLDNGAATDIVVDGDNIYLSGHFDNYVYGAAQPPVMVVSYWKNGSITKLQNPIADISGGIPNAGATSIAVYGSDVYVGGWGNGSYGGGNYVALYWKNSAATNLTSYSSGVGNLCAKSMVNDLVLQGSDVYMAGGIIPATGILANPADVGGAVYWKNKKPVQLFDNSIYSQSNVIGINGTTIYTAGPFNLVSAYYKKANSLVMLKMNGESPNATGIAFYNDDVYISGYTYFTGSIGGVAGYWKNGVLVTLATSEAQATGIVVTKRQ